MIQAAYDNDIERLKALIPRVDEFDWPERYKEDYHLIINARIESVKNDIYPDYEPDKR